MAEDESDDHEWHIRLKQDEEMDFFTELALHEAERWIQAITRKKFKYPDDFRGSLANGVLLCELLNGLKPGSVKRINKLPGAIAGLDNINVFLTACKKNFGLNKTHLFDPGDLEDLSQRAIADESEYLLKQEVDRRARNVAITIYWLGRHIEGTYKGPSLDFSAFSALVHHQGNKNIISDKCFKNENWQTTQGQSYKDVNVGSHARDSSYDSLGSYEKESESSFELENNENMPVRDLRRFGSQSSLGKNESTHYSVANDSAFSDGRHDSLYQSSPELSQGSHAHTRSSSADSMDGSYYGNSHSRQSSGSTESYPRLTSSGTGSGRRIGSTSSTDPLQFVKVKRAEELAKNAAKQIEAAKETTLMRPTLRADEGEPDWQSKLSGWKSRRKSASADIYQRVGEVEGVFLEEEEKPKTKTFSQMAAEREKRKSLGNLRSFYPMDDDSTLTTKKLSDPLHIMKSEDEITQATEIKTKKKEKGDDIAPWAMNSSGDGDSQSNSETNVTHQSGDTDNVFSEQSISKVINEDESWVKRRSASSSQSSPSLRQTPPPVSNKSIRERNMQLWENSAKESQIKMEKQKVDIPTSKSNNKIKDITKAFEEKENSAKAEPVISRRSEIGRKSWSFDSNESPFRRRSSDFSDKSDKSSPKGFNEKNVSPLLSPTSPKALLPKDQRPTSSSYRYSSEYSSKKNLVEKTIKISQAPNNSRGFGFFVQGGSDKREPVIVHKVSLGSSADVSDVLANDEVLSVNNHDVSNMTLKQVQAIIDGSVKRGQIELTVRRRPDEGSFDSLDEEGGGYPGSSNKMETQSDSSSFSTDPLSDDASYKTPQSFSRQTGSDDNEKPSLMDRLLAEKSREANNNFDLFMYKTEQTREDKPPSPVAAENLKAEISFSSHMTPSRRSPVIPPKTERSVGSKSERSSEQLAFSSHITPNRESPVSRSQMETSSEPKSSHAVGMEHDIISPDGQMVVEERQTISVKPRPVVEEEPPVVMRRKRTPESLKEEPVKSAETPLPAQPTPEPAVLPRPSSKSDDDDSGGIGPPAALLRWQRPRPKSEYRNPYPSLFDKQVEEAKRLSSTLPWRSSDSDNRESSDVTKDDSVLTRATKDFESTVTGSKPPLTKSKTYHFDDASKLQDWDKKQEEERQHEPHVERPVTPPAFEVEIHKEERLTPQLESKPGRKVGVPNLIEIPVSIPSKDDSPLSPQEKFERDQQRIRHQYEEEKRRARESEKQREQQEQKLIREDADRLLHLESQIQSNKVDDIKPVHPVQSKPPQFTSEPLTIKAPASSQGRQLVIDPRNQEESRDAPLPQYTFHVDLQKQEDKPKLRTLNQEPELSAEEMLERERERIREEEHRKFEEEKRRWKAEQDEKLRKEQERLKEEREAIEREKAKLEQKQESSSRYQPLSVHTYQSQKSPSGSAGSSLSQSPRSPPPALDPSHRGSSGPARKVDIWAPPSTKHTASKNDLGSKEKARLTREDLLAMNRKATPLQSVAKKPGEHDSAKESEHVTREAPSKLELHMLNSVPKPRFRGSGDWIKGEEDESSAHTDKYADKQFVIGKRSDIIHKDYSNPQDHWVVQEAERRRLAENKDNSPRVDSSVHTAGPAKPSTSSLINRFRGDVEPNRKNRYSYPAPRDTDSHRSSTRPLSTDGSSLRRFERSASPELSSTQFSARNQSLNFANPSLSNTLPANFSFNANKPSRREAPATAPKPQRTPTEQAEQMHTVSGKQKCSHCNEELGFGAAMVIESLGLYYHVQCFRCCVCHTPLGNGSEGADVRVRVNKLHCRNCFSNDEAGLKFSKV